MVLILRKNFENPVKFSELVFIKDISLSSIIINVFIIFAALSIIAFTFRKKIVTDAYFFIACLSYYFILTLWKNNNAYYSIGVIIILSIFVGFVLKKGYLKEISNPKKRTTIVIISLLFFAYVVIIGGLTVCRYLIYYSSCFDFGIFAQMYYYMKETLLPNTTCERNELLSHFAIHVSPIYYIILPIYYVFPSPVTLLVLQAIIVASGIFPLYKLCKKHNLTNAITICICIAYIATPALIGANFFDFHENKFLTPLILWFLYFLEKKKWLGMYIFMALTLMVKEDAPVYVACIALFVIFSKKNYKHGTIIFASAIGYFLAVTKILESFGRGVMTGRYGNYLLNAEDSLFTVIINCLKNPAYVLSEAFQEKKFLFFLLMMIPVAFIPLINKKPTQLFLIIPFLLVNLMPDYVYQYSIGYQYTCGVIALFFYLIVVNISNIKAENRKYIASFMAIASIVISVSQWSYTTFYYDFYSDTGVQRNTQVDMLLESIPEEASVEASTFFIPKLSQRKELYLTVKPEQVTWEPTDYVVLMLSDKELCDVKIPYIEANGYDYVGGYENYLSIYKLKGSVY